MTKKQNVHVVHRDDGWGVRKEGNKRDSSRHDTQRAAANVAIDAAKKAGVDVVIHGRDGKIRSKDSYGNDPNPPKDTEH
jgi:hypothetical protein